MKATFFQCSLIAVTLIMCFALSCTDQAKKTAEQTAAAKADIAAYIDAYAATLKAGDVNGWIALWADDARRMEPFQPARIGKDQIMASIQTFLDTFAIDLKINNEETTIAGDWGYISGTFLYSAIQRAGGGTMEISGSYLSIMQRQADGAWKVFRECYNTDTPPAAPPPMKGK